MVDTSKRTGIKASYGMPSERIYSEARNPEQVLVIGIKDGQPVMWASGDEAKAQELLAQFFPSAVLPETRELESAGHRDR